MKISRLLLTTLLAGSPTGMLFAASTAPVTPVTHPGTKSNVTLTLTTTTEIGGFLVKDSALAAQENKGILYYSPSNPLGYAPATNDPANYYRTKESRKSKTFTFDEGPQSLTIESTTEEAAKLVSQKFTNADFIQQLKDRELVAIPSIAGYKLVMVQPAETLDTNNDQPLLFFIENENSILYVGRHSSSGQPLACDALFLSFSDGVETYNYKSNRVFAHKTETQIIEGRPTVVLIEDEAGTRTVSDVFSGRSVASIALFGSYYDEEQEEYLSQGGPAFYASGELNYKGSYNAKAGQYITASASMPAAVGNYYGYDADSETSFYGFTKMSFGVAGTKKLNDITPYLNALPPELADLKAEILGDGSDVAVTATPDK